MHIPAELLPVLQITLPVILAILGAAWIQNKRIDDIKLELREIRDELRKIREELAHHGERLSRLEERGRPPLVRSN